MYYIVVVVTARRVRYIGDKILDASVMWSSNYSWAFTREREIDSDLRVDIVMACNVSFNLYLTSCVSNRYKGHLLDYLSSHFRVLHPANQKPGKVRDFFRVLNETQLERERGGGVVLVLNNNFTFGTISPFNKAFHPHWRHTQSGARNWIIALISDLNQWRLNMLHLYELILN